MILKSFIADWNSIELDILTILILSRFSRTLTQPNDSQHQKYFFFREEILLCFSELPSVTFPLKDFHHRIFENNFQMKLQFAGNFPENSLYQKFVIRWRSLHIKFYESWLRQFTGKHKFHSCRWIGKRRARRKTYFCEWKRSRIPNNRYAASKTVRSPKKIKFSQ